MSKFKSGDIILTTYSDGNKHINQIIEGWGRYRFKCVCCLSENKCNTNKTFEASENHLEKYSKIITVEELNQIKAEFL